MTTIKKTFSELRKLAKRRRLKNKRLIIAHYVFLVLSILCITWAIIFGLFFNPSITFGIEVLNFKLLDAGALCFLVSYIIITSQVDTYFLPSFYKMMEKYETLKIRAMREVGETERARAKDVKDWPKKIVEESKWCCDCEALLVTKKEYISGYCRKCSNAIDSAFARNCF